jgi:hypothetical protein
LPVKRGLEQKSQRKLERKRNGDDLLESVDKKVAENGLFCKVASRISLLDTELLVSKR